MAIVVAIADLISMISRPIILAVRLFMNIMVGQLVISSVYAILQPAILKAMYISVLLKALICTGLSFWEMGVGIFQATLFVYLCLVYRGDGSYQS
uniref:ATP synthase subunit a n=1 Tax=Dreissena polymorpha TaxID=45954 RepID=A0A7D7ACK3_DREPO|nr:ATP synthase F0 subunit 6 [Dreissena polymorpha]